MEQQNEKEEAEAAIRKAAQPQSGMGRCMVPVGLSTVTESRPSRRSPKPFSRACASGRRIEAQLNLGLSYWNLGDHDGAARAFESVLESDPEAIDALRGSAALAVEARRRRESALDLQSET